MYRGILIPVITPFHDDSSIDVETLRQLVDFYFSAKVQGLFALGSSGQGSGEGSSAGSGEIGVTAPAGRWPWARPTPSVGQTGGPAPTVTLRDKWRSAK